MFFAVDNLVFYKASVGDYMEIKRLLGCYANALGLKINLQKFAVTFSPNVHPNLCLDILSCLGMSLSSSHDKYLGLFTLIVCNKRSSFNALR